MLKRAIRFVSALVIVGIAVLSSSADAAVPQQFWRPSSGSFDPNLFSGAGTYSVPIEIPAGRNGVQPTIGLTYNSLDSSAGSIVGYGWSLSEARIVRHTEESQLELYDGEFLLEMQGGNAGIKNAQNTCRTCNLQKGTSTTAQFLGNKK